MPGCTRLNLPLRGAISMLLLGIPLAVAGVASPVSRAQDQDQQKDFDRLADAAGLRAGGSFPFDYQFLAFRGPTADSVSVWAATSVHAGRMRGVFEGGWKYTISMQFEVLDEMEQQVAFGTAKIEHTLSARIPEETSDGFPLQANVWLPPGRYTYRVTVTDENWPAGRSVNQKEGDLYVPSLEDHEPLVSSLAVAADSMGLWEPTHEVALKLNAARIVNKDSRPFVYYEVYGLTPGGDYRGEVRLQSTWDSYGKDERFTGSYQPFQLQYRGTAPSERTEPVRSIFRLDMRNTEPGPYDIRVKVTDMVTGRSSGVRRVSLKVQDYDEKYFKVPVTEVKSAKADDGGRGR